MAILPQWQLFSWQEIEGLGDLERLVLIFEYMLDEKLMQQLERRRGRPRKDEQPVTRMVYRVRIQINELEQEAYLEAKRMAK